MFDIGLIGSKDVPLSVANSGTCKSVCGWKNLRSWGEYDEIDELTLLEW